MGLIDITLDLQESHAFLETAGCRMRLGGLSDHTGHLCVVNQALLSVVNGSLENRHTPEGRCLLLCRSAVRNLKFGCVHLILMSNPSWLVEVLPRQVNGAWKAIQFTQEISTCIWSGQELSGLQWWYQLDFHLLWLKSGTVQTHTCPSETLKCRCLAVNPTYSSLEQSDHVWAFHTKLTWKAS